MMRNSGSGHPHGHAGNTHKGDKRASTLARVNEERLAYAISCLVGKDVVVHMNGGRIMKGTFHSCDPVPRPTKAYDIALRHARAVQNKSEDSGSGRQYVVFGTDYQYVVASGVSMGPSAKESKSANAASAPPAGEGGASNKRSGSGKFKTDTEISGSKGQRHSDKLVEWASEAPVADNQLYVLEAQRKTEWDQFESNRKDFGVESTYDESLYTTELNMDDVPQRIQDQATRLASEILGSSGEGGYSQLESYLEQDEDAVNNAVTEQIVKKALARNSREERREEKREEKREDRREDKREEKYSQGNKGKTRSSGGDGAAGGHNSRPASSSRVMSYKDIIANSSTSPSQSQKGAATQDNTPQQGGHGKGAGHERDSAQHTVRFRDAFPATVFQQTSTARSDVNRGRAANVEARGGEHGAEESRKGERGGASHPQKAEERAAAKPAVETKPASPASQTSGTIKKTFTFNPNASSFTPFSAAHIAVRLASPSRRSGSRSPMRQAQGPQKAGYPVLDVSAYTVLTWPLTDYGLEDGWQNCSDVTYRSVIGDLSQYYAAPGIVAMRPQHPMVASAGMTTVLLPQAGPVTYPAYQLGGIPVNMVPYNRQVTPKFFARQAQQPMQPIVPARRPMNGATTPSIGHAQPQVKPKL
ncbi:ataxin-2 N-terminal region domain containing protein, putative [Babesia bigemina]|uniref:Ataxin-2 N-terminal region domain containing protein, putative n=1 Tax=Babesia bigemina TaxID=5866 RepID=A0A061D9Z5_BABBI|nr:ataxin-2 N-terminal region domain containing protein, putative [Babesia bigemina]CDR97328.1 ataxin-2 N-terminal region domain containing protein, putative [Babesia bigemina]|eukprot:XP_012769514.1 ataxin-2 N-terminal region domain containing protein, putative [Babesia bigemina]